MTPISASASVFLAVEPIRWIEAALVIFVAVFVLVVIRVVLRRRGHFDHASRIPLDDDRIATPPQSPASGPAGPGDRS